jgi:Fe-S-cluster containining protein
VIVLSEDWLGRAEEICMRCGGHCCVDAHPPVSRSCCERLTAAGVSPDLFEEAGYRRLKAHENGVCILSEHGKCIIHAIKPETCRAGPFTFDVRDDVIEIYLKFSRICPLVTLLKGTPEAYQLQYDLAVKSITHLVRNLTQAEIEAVCRIDEPETEKVAEVPRRNPEIS